MHPNIFVKSTKFVKQKKKQKSEQIKKGDTYQNVFPFLWNKKGRQTPPGTSSQQKYVTGQKSVTCS